MGCAAGAVDEAIAASPADVAPELTPAACLAQSPVDLSIQVGGAPPSFYVNDLRLGYSRGEAIFLSRPLCDMYGESLCRFVEAHEQAHHFTKTVGQQSVCAETLADCWAAAHADEEAVEAALFFFRSRRGEGGYHGQPSVRADIIARCLARRQKTLASGADGAPTDGAAAAVSMASGSLTPTRVAEMDDHDREASGAAPTPRSRGARPFRVWGRAHRRD
jgi:hypothetical protein